MTEPPSHDWAWYRCSILGCGAGPILVRKAPRLVGHWALAYPDGASRVMAGSEPGCPHGGDELESLMPTIHKAGWIHSAAQAEAALAVR
jgi:hypothetical protein